jgi:hypothetical protein
MAARNANERLGTPKDFVVCELKRKVIAPSVLRDVTSIVRKYQFVLQWTDPENDGNTPMTRHVVRGSGNNLATGNQTTVLRLQSDTEYTFTVAAVNAIGQSSDFFHYLHECCPGFCTDSGFDCRPARHPIIFGSSLHKL